MVAREGQLTIAREGRDRRGFWSFFLLPGGGWLIALFLVPLGVVVAASFAEPNILGFPEYGWHPGNYAYVFKSYYVPVLVRTVAFAAGATVTSLVIALPTAYTIARFGGRRKNLLIALFVLPWFVDYLVRIYAWVVLLAPAGIVNGWLHRLGMSGDPPVSLLNTWFAVLGGLTYSYFPFMMLPIYATLEALDRG